ncbi:hypothetical protein F5B22DRAFT_659460 [Xylaria bambusicola]|uniref:uncharacterized protein n=1 Tax=Xylaria bambusicola TaxID=326684 RepID=UPI00200798DC|nr:uncharacterized protein F5B22DRAFT_659460 [Xylaria bambusicola]KAI0523714.1 hypothetical protein F5B22DRAFT_659460 [Xylaria bambusicola]
MKYDKRDFAAIEFLLRKGRRQLELYAAPGIKDIRLDDDYAQFALEGESASSTKVRLPVANRCRRSAPRTAYASNISVSSTSSISYINMDCESADACPRGLAIGKIRHNAGYLRHFLDSTYARRPERKTPNREKRFGLADPLAWDVINRSLTQQHRLSSLVDPDGPGILPPKQSSNKTIDVTSSDSSQRRALNRFARELEKYADAAGAAGKDPVITPTISESKASLHTVKPLVPYKDEFLAAGLAVTSAEQRRALAHQTNAQATHRTTKPHQHSSRTLETRKKPATPGDGPSSNASPSISCTSSGSYIEFSPRGGHMLHAVDTLVPRRGTAKSKCCHHARKRLISWFIKKPTSKSSSILAHHPPVRTHHVHGRQVNSNGPSSAHLGRRRLQHKTHKPFIQDIPEVQLWPKPVPPVKYVTPKKNPCVALNSDYYEQRDLGFHSAEENTHQHAPFDAKQSLGSFGLQGKRNITKGVLPKPLPVPIATIDEETEVNTLTDNNAPNGSLPPAHLKEAPSVVEGPSRRINGESSMTHQSSVPSLPFAARLAASTASSLQRALDDAYQKVESDTQKAGSLPEKEAIKKEPPPPIPRRDSRHNASHHPHPRRPRSTDKFIYVKRNMPTVEASSSSSKPLPPAPLSVAQVTPKKRPDIKPPQPKHTAPPTPRPLTGKRKNAVAELAKAEEMLRDLDVFLNDYDDAAIEDRDVIKGLQVAIHAAADDLYDGYIRHKTGLRIRRFLADLKSFEDITELGPTDQRAREKRAETRRLEGVRNRKNDR